MILVVRSGALGVNRLHVQAFCYEIVTPQCSQLRERKQFTHVNWHVSREFSVWGRSRSPLTDEAYGCSGSNCDPRRSIHSRSDSIVAARPRPLRILAEFFPVAGHCSRYDRKATCTRAQHRTTTACTLRSRTRHRRQLDNRACTCMADHRACPRSWGSARTLLPMEFSWAAMTA